LYFISKAILFPSCYVLIKNRKAHPCQTEPAGARLFPSLPFSSILTFSLLQPQGVVKAQARIIITIGGNGEPQDGFGFRYCPCPSRQGKSSGKFSPPPTWVLLLEIRTLPRALRREQEATSMVPIHLSVSFEAGGSVWAHNTATRYCKLNLSFLVPRGHSTLVSTCQGPRLSNLSLSTQRLIGPRLFRLASTCLPPTRQVHSPVARGYCYDL